MLDQWDTPAQTWVWDGTTWTQKAPVVSPTSGSPALMAYDSAHQVIVLLESQTLPNGLNVIVTWTWDGTNWTKHTAATTPPAGQGQSVAGDAASGQVVLFGGLLLDSSHRGLTNATWTWDGTTWTEQFPANSLSARWGQSIAYDSTHEAVVLVGGSSSTEAFTDTWTWDGTNWTQRVPAMAPALGGPIADDPLDGGVLMFGGPSPSDQTWHWNGTVWSQVIPTPLGRHGAAFGYDAATSNVVLFGGCCYSNGHLFADTWVRNGLGWRPIHPAVSPSSRVNPSMAYDAVSQKVVLFGGCATDGPPSTALGDTWSWDGTTWQQLTSSSPGPQAQCGAALASIGNRSGHPSILLFGSDGTWIWQNNWWHQPSLSASPPLQDNDALSVDPTTGTALLLGAPTGGSTCGCYDTWQWNGATWIQRFPTASPPNITASPRMAYDAAIGRTILFLSAGPDQTWSWTGSNWIQLFPINTTWLVTGPPAMAYNAKTKQLLLFGGKDFNSKDQDATWVLGSGS